MHELLETIDGGAEGRGASSPDHAVRAACGVAARPGGCVEALVIGIQCGDRFIDGRYRDL